MSVDLSSIVIFLITLLTVATNQLVNDGIMQWGCYIYIGGLYLLFPAICLPLGKGLFVVLGFSLFIDAQPPLPFGFTFILNAYLKLYSILVATHPFSGPRVNVTCLYSLRGISQL